MTSAFDWASDRLVSDLSAIGLSRADLTEVRFKTIGEQMSDRNGPGPAMTRVITESFGSGGTALEVRIYVPVPNPDGIVVLFPPGAWLDNDLDHWDTVARKLAERTAFAFASIQTRTASASSIGAAHADAVRGAHLVSKLVASIAPSATGLSVLGVGAGASLAVEACASLVQDEDNELAVDLLILVAPITGPQPVKDSDVPDSYPFLSSADVPSVWDSSSIDGADDAYLGLSGHSEDLGWAPPTLVLSAGLDPACPQAYDLVSRLEGSGVPVVMREFENQLHEFFSFIELPLGERAFQHVVRALRGSRAKPHLDGHATWLERIVK